MFSLLRRTKWPIIEFVCLLDFTPVFFQFFSIKFFSIIVFPFDFLHLRSYNILLFLMRFNFYNIFRCKLNWCIWTTLLLFWWFLDIILFWRWYLNWFFRINNRLSLYCFWGFTVINCVVFCWRRIYITRTILFFCLGTWWISIFLIGGWCINIWLNWGLYFSCFWRGTH